MQGEGASVLCMLFILLRHCMTGSMLMTGSVSRLPLCAASSHQPPSRVKTPPMLRYHPPRASSYLSTYPSIHPGYSSGRPAA